MKLSRTAGRAVSDSDACLTNELADWFQSSLGQAVFAAEEALLADILPQLFGYHLAQIGCLAHLDLLKHSPIPHKIHLSPRMQLGLDAHAVVARPEELPLQSQALDAVLLHHALDFSDDPHQVLREAARVLRPGGHLLILGFNPLSFWGVCRWRRREQAPWNARALSHHRLHDWLRLLELTELKSETAFYLPLLASESWRTRLNFLESWTANSLLPSGAVLLVWARKDVGGMTPLKPAWKTRKLIAFPLAEPTARNKSARGKSV